MGRSDFFGTGREKSTGGILSDFSQNFFGQREKTGIRRGEFRSHCQWTQEKFCAIVKLL